MRFSIHCPKRRSSRVIRDREHAHASVTPPPVWRAREDTMWSGAIISQRTSSRMYTHLWRHRGASPARRINILAPWLATLEMDNDQGAASGDHSANQARTAEEQIEFERLFTQRGGAARLPLWPNTQPRGRDRPHAGDLSARIGVRYTARRGSATQGLAVSHRYESRAQPEPPAAALRLAAAGDGRAAGRGG